MKPIDILIRGSYVMIRLVVIALVFSIVDSFVDVLRTQDHILAIAVHSVLIYVIISVLIRPFIIELTDMIKEQNRIDRAKK